MSDGRSWLDINEDRRYPLADDADVDSLPNDVLADLYLAYPEDLGDTVSLWSISSNGTYVSFVLNAMGTDIAYFTGEPTPRRLYPLTPLVDGVTGSVVFGNGLPNWRGRLDLSDAELAVGTMTRTPALDLPNLTLRKLGLSDVSLDGVVTLAGGQYVTVSLVDQLDHAPLPAPFTQAILIELVSNIPATANRDLINQQARNIVSDNILPGIVNKVNGVRPDKDGNLTIRVLSDDDFVIDKSTVGSEPALRISTRLAADRNCPRQEGVVSEPENDIIVEPPNECIDT